MRGPSTRLTIDPVWTQVKKLTASDGVADDQFGISVAISGDIALVGAWHDDVAIFSDNGSAYLFERNTGGADNWGQVKKLVASDGAASDQFGSSVAINVDTAIVGADQADVGGLSNQGYAYVFTIIGEPEINVKGNGTSIADGDSTPDAADHTDFGSTAISGGMIGRTFTIENTSNNSALTVNGITLSGTHTTDFSVSGITLPATINASSSTTFMVTFDPSAAGTRTATVNIANNDSDENLYDFAVQGTGATIPESNVKGNTVTIADGDATPSATDHTDFGNAPFAGGTVTRIFTIENTGGAPLNLTGTPKVQISGANAADFTVTVQPASPVAATNGTTTFTIVFDPSAVGLRSATISLANDDCNENAYDFAIQGTGNVPPTLAAQAGVSRERGAALSNSPIATVDDAEDAEESLIVSVSSDGNTFAATATHNGVTVNNLTVDSKGLVKADVVAACSATNASFTLKVKDSSQLTATATLSVAVTADRQPPTLSNCPVNLSRNNDPGKCTALVTYTSPTVNDNCAGATVACSPASGSAFQKGTTTVTCTATDAAGNTATCSFTVTVNDTQAPVITGPANQTRVTARPGDANVAVNYPAPIATDNCSVATVVCLPPSGSIFAVGTTTVSCTATDTSGNTASCSFTVSLFDACLQDDSSPTTAIVFNTRTGDYRFCCSGSVFTGKGSVVKQGNFWTLTHNSADRRVLAKVDSNANNGTASLQTPPGTVRCSILDRDIRNNTCQYQ
jgi:hypothetical protein